MYKKEITKPEINELPQAVFKGKIHIISKKDDYLRAIDTLGKKTHLGFDTETRPAFKKGVSYDVSLLQLSTNDDAFLFRLKHHEFGTELKQLLEDQSILKTGVAIRDDLKGLKKLNSFEPGNFVEIANLAKQLEIKQLGLRSLAAILLDVRISKRYQLTNWELTHLTEDQLRYAATDAWVGLKLYRRMNELIELVKKTKNSADIDLKSDTEE